MGLASSAVYRYFKSRDELLTTLIIDAYDALGETAEQAESTVDRAHLFGRWSATCHALRSWAMAHPHEYALLYGSPVPGYRAPEATIGPATRVTLLLARVLQDAVARNPPRSDDLPPLPARARETVAALSAYMFGGGPEPIVLRGVMAWIEIFGAVSFELFGHLHNVVSDYDAFFDSVVESTAAFVGVRPAD